MATDKPNYNKVMPAYFKTAYSSKVKPPRQTKVKQWHIDGRHPNLSIEVNPIYVQWLRLTNAQPGDVVDTVGFQLYRRRLGYELNTDWKQIISNTANLTRKEVSCHE